MITRDLEKQLNKLTEPKAKKLVKNYINTTLFEVRKFSLGPMGIRKEMIIRNSGLIRSHLIVRKATNKPGGCIGYFGSLADDRFSGWEEQEKGTATRRKITVHKKNARGASGKRSLKQKFRRNAGPTPLLQNQKNTETDRQKITATMAILRRSGFSGAVILTKGYYKKWPGIYEFTSKPFKTSKTTRKKRRNKRLKAGLPVSDRIYDNGIKLKLMEIFKRKQPKLNHWGTNVIKRYLQIHDSKKIVEKELSRMFK